MSGARPKLSPEALSAEELRFLEAVKRTREEASPPPSVDVGAIAAKAFASYLEGVEGTDPEPIPGLAAVLSRTTPGLQRTVANLINEESNEQKPSIHFRRDFTYTLVPTIVLAFLGIGYLLFRSKVNLSSSVLSSSVLVKTSIAVTVLTAIGFTIWFLVDPDRISSHLRSIRYSGGALTGGLSLATLALLAVNFGLDQRGKWQNTRIENTSREMAELGFATVGPTVGGTSLEKKTQLNFVGSQQTAFVFKSEQGGEAVKVEAKPDNNRTNASVVLDMVPYSAKVYSFGSTVADYEVLTGKVVDYSDQNQDLVEIKPDGGATPIKVTLDSNARQAMYANFSELRETGLTGKDVKVLFVPKSSQALKMSWRRQGTDELIYNSASASLKQTAAIAPEP